MAEEDTNKTTENQSEGEAAPSAPDIPQRFKIKTDRAPEVKKEETKPPTSSGISYEVGSRTKGPAPEPLKQTPRSVGQLPRIRTYAADMSGAIKKRGETLATIVNKERVSKKKPEYSDTEKAERMKRLAIGIGVVVLVLAGAFAVVGALFFSGADEQVVVSENGIIFANDTVEIIVRERTDLDEELSGLRQTQNLSLGEVLRIDLIENNTQITGSELASRLGVPGSLAREVTNTMVGIHSFDRNQPFIIFEVLAYDRSFGSLLSWEKDMGRELGEFFKPTGATTSAPTLQFEDRIIRNLDVRVSQSRWPILYAFPERNMLILTTNEFTLQEILTRLQSSLR